MNFYYDINHISIKLTTSALQLLVNVDLKLCLRLC